MSFLYQGIMSSKLCTDRNNSNL